MYYQRDDEEDDDDDKDVDRVNINHAGNGKEGEAGRDYRRGGYRMPSAHGKDVIAAAGKTPENGRKKKAARERTTNATTPTRAPGEW